MIDYKDIMQLIINQDPKGLEELYDTYGKKFYTYCVHNWHLSEDESWEVIYKTLETLILKLAHYEFESKQHFDNFLYKVLTNFLRQYFRKNRCNSEHELAYVDLMGEEADSSEINKHINQLSFTDYYKSEFIDSPELLHLNEALETLDPLDKDILLLRAQNYSYDEISAFLGVENKQLKVTHHRAKKKLIDKLIEKQL
ncbi:RNA polymerase sigma factor [Mucilaginibacter polytrichastri]|nr:RNA polymerase sigma factor [Mucilaginibacter polytrichastri]SFT02601.1 RNA polymerase sigma-70 factor, ECF subfamily [Mucilaginibacter polytrichastri]